MGAGIDGIKNKIDPGEPVIGSNMYSLDPEDMLKKGTKILPQNLFEAVNELKNDDVVKEALGPIADEFIRLKSLEWKSFHSTVTRWELERYLTMF
jgi:glutamine synthetase